MTRHLIMDMDVDFPALAGITFRQFRGEPDYPAIVAVQNASQAADPIEETGSLEEVANDFQHLDR